MTVPELKIECAARGLDVDERLSGCPANSSPVNFGSEKS